MRVRTHDFRTRFTHRSVTNIRHYGQGKRNKKNGIDVISFAAGKPEIIKAASALQDHSTSNPNSIAQKAALAALIGSQKTVAYMREAYKDRCIRFSYATSDENIKKGLDRFEEFVENLSSPA